MKRSEVLRKTAAAAALVVATTGLPSRARALGTTTEPAASLAGVIPVAFLLSDGAVMIDFAGPWEVFQDAQVVGRTAPAFTPYTVAETKAPVATSGGALILPAYTIANAPTPKIIVVPAQSDPSAPVTRWLKNVARQADLVMSVCTGALVLAQAGLLDGQVATTHHSALTTLAMQYPQVAVRRGVRFVDNGRIATSAGLSAGIDLALHVVERYYGKESAVQTAYDMEYLSNHWADGKNEQYRTPQVVGDGNVICEVCWMEIARETALTSTFRGKTYYFCMPNHQRVFDSAPARFVDA